MPGTVATTCFRCGPLEIEVSGEQGPELTRVHLTLDIYSAAWEAPPQCVHLRMVSGTPRSGMLAGTWLKTARMRVEADGAGMHATCLSGPHATFDRHSASWQIVLPPGPIDIWRLTDIEHLMSLVLTTGWRELGWVPVHAGAVVRDGTCAMLCAPSGGGKTTFTTALLRRGWDSPGDDKLLLRCEARSRPELRALIHSLNLFPHSVRWFPELTRIEELPAYSVWTDKRRVPMDMIRTGSALQQATPTHIVRVTRSEGMRGIRVAPITAQETLDLLMRQTVIPSDRRLAREIVGVIARTAGGARGFSVEIGDDAYEDPDHLNAFDEAILA